MILVFRLLLIENLVNSDKLIADDIVWGLAPEVVSASQAQVEHYKADINSILEKFDADKYYNEEYSLEKFTRLIRAIGIVRILSGQYNKFLELIDKYSADEYPEIIAKEVIKQTASLLSTYPQLSRFGNLLDESFIPLQIKYGVKSSNMFFPGVANLTLKELYENIYTKFQSDIGLSFSAFIGTLPNSLLCTIRFDVDSATLMNSFIGTDNFIRERLVDTFEINDIDSILALDSNVYDLSNICITNKMATTFTESKLDEYLSRVKQGRRSFYMRELSPEVLTANIISKHIAELSGDYGFFDAIEKRFSLKEMLQIIE